MNKENEQVQKAPENGPDMAGQTKTDTNKSEIAKLEEKVLEFWQTNKVFEQSVEKEAPKGEYTFYDGPPFATGIPHIGHVFIGVVKDAIPRYQTMKGYRVKRRWGWDCHGLPIENLIQKEKNLKTKKDIEDFGIKNFNKAAKDIVFRYDKEWKEIVPRTGRWVDMEDQYTTMDPTFMESVMWAFKTLHDKGHVYEGFQTMYISPLLETSLSNFEVNQAYKDITDISVFAKFELKDEKNTYFIAWTTTPWTLPGNVALAVGPKMDYVKVAHNFDGKDEQYIVAKDLLEKVMKEKEYKVISEMKGEELIGKEYEPIFDYYSKDKELENRKNGWKVYGADFVTTEDGTGIVHIAPAFGEDDLNLMKEHELPFVQHVNIDGTMKEEVTDFAGRQAKPKATEDNQNAHQETDIEVIKWLAHNGKLFDKQKLIHSYPHCPRTDAPLLNYAMSSWFIKVTDYKDKMIKQNKKVNWVPKSVGEKRFGNWLENIKDWGVSRSRYWGTPMPIWRSEDGTETEVLGSLEEIREKTKGNNTYYVMRHGEGDHNVKNFLSADDSVVSNLTDKGKNDVKKVALELKDKKVDLIFISPLMRTEQSAKIIAETCGIDEKNIIAEDRLTEVQSGVLNGQSSVEYHKLFDTHLDKFYKAPENGETLSDVRKRVGEFMYEIDTKYNDKRILIITHDYPIWMLNALRSGFDNETAASLKEEGIDYVTPGHYAEYDFAPIPHDDDFVLDYHRPYIDDIKYMKNGKQMKRVEEVFDTWFDSGAMPFAVNHYPFNKEVVDPNPGFLSKAKGFPADFIAEGLDQTRGWFYTLLAMNVGLFGKAPYKNVVVTGLVLAEDGKKMSKSLNNYAPVKDVLDQYGADAIRYYLLSSPLVRSESVAFLDKGVDEIVKKINNRLSNVVSFYEMYATDGFAESDVRPDSDNPLDDWILNRLSETEAEVSKGMDNYELDKASRPILDFVDDLSTWYVRRSRDRFKIGNEVDKNIATKTMAYVLLNTSKIIAPFMPFLAENVYQRLTGADMKEGTKSVHLTDWPKLSGVNKDSLKDMKEIRDVVNNALEARDKVGIKVRQPLQKLTISDKFSKKNPGLIEIIKEEVNIKEVDFDETLEKDEVKLDTDISESLKKEGISRELVRFIQSLRKKAGLNPNDSITLNIKTDKSGQDLVNEYKEDITNTARVERLTFSDIEGEEIETEGYKFSVKI